MLHVSAEEQKERLLARLDDPTSSGSSSPATSTSAQRWRDYEKAYEIALERCNTDRRALVRRSRATASGTATGPSASCCSRRCRGWSWSGRSPTTTSRSSAPGWSRRGDRGEQSRVVRQVRATRYVTPLREGGSLPGIVEADDLGIYVCKFRGAGQGLRVLVAEVVVGGCRPAGRRARPGPGGRRPRRRRSPATRPTRRCRTCSTPASGVNLGVDFLPGAFGYDPPTSRTATSRGGSSGWTRCAPTSTVMAQPQPAGLAR